MRSRVNQRLKPKISTPNQTVSSVDNGKTRLNKRRAPIYKPSKSRINPLNINLKVRQDNFKEFPYQKS